MIEKKPPQFTGPVDLDDEFPDAGADTDHRTADMISEEQSDSAVGLDRARERKGLLITYGTGAVFFAIVVILAYPQFKKYFVTTPKVQSFAGVPVPSGLRSHILAGPNASPAPAPAGALPEGPVAGPVSNVPPLTNSSTPAAGPAAGGATDSAQGTAPAVPDSATPSSGGTQPVAPAPALGSGVSGALEPGQAALPSVSPGLPSAALPNVAPPAGASSVSVAKVEDMSNRLGALETGVKDLGAQKDIVAGQMQQIQSSLDGMQKQLNDLANRGVAAAAPAGGSPHVSRRHRHAHQAAARDADEGAGGLDMPQVAAPARANGSWELRSATPGSALISQPGSNDLKHVAPGDMVSGLGKITSVEMQNGSWIVRGTKGSVSQ